MFPLVVQSAPLEQQLLSDQAIQARGEAIEKTQNWAALADFFESLDPTTRGRFLVFWLKSLQRAQRWSRMLDVCDAAIPQLEAKSGPRPGLARLLRANALAHLKRHAEALAAHVENAKLGSPTNYRSACSEARLVPDWLSEQSCAEALLLLKPDDAEALAWKGEALAQQNNFKAAEPVLRAAIQGDPGQALALSNLGRCLNERGALAEALEVLNRALVLEPTLFEAHYNRGRTNFELKRFQASVEDFHFALTSNPEDPVLRENLRQAERYLKAQRNGAKSR